MNCYYLKTNNMKNSITLLFLLPTILFAQVKAETKHKVVQKQIVKIAAIKKVNPLPVYEIPEFEGGMTALDSYVANNFKMSRKDRKKEVEGQIKVRFIIAADGTIKNAKVINGGMSEKLNKEALKVINAMPKWKPGTENGKAVDVLYLYTIQVG